MQVAIPNVECGMQACHTRHGIKSNLSFGSNLEGPNNFGAGFEGLHCLLLFRHLQRLSALGGRNFPRVRALRGEGTFGAARGPRPHRKPALHPPEAPIIVVFFLKAFKKAESSSFRDTVMLSLVTGGKRFETANTGWHLQLVPAEITPESSE